MRSCSISNNIYWKEMSNLSLLQREANKHQNMIGESQDKFPCVLRLNLRQRQHGRTIGSKHLSLINGVEIDKYPWKCWLHIKTQFHV